jgi:hypothetical protein
VNRLIMSAPSLLFVAMLIGATRASAQSPAPTAASAVTGPVQVQRVTPKVLNIDLRRTTLTAPVKFWFPGRPIKVIEDLRENGERRPTPTATALSLAPAFRLDAALQPIAAPSSSVGSPPIPGVRFDGIPATGFLPPDTVGAVGPSHYVQMVNSDLAIYNKSGTLLAGPVAINSFWAGFGGPCASQNSGDPIVRYDATANRFVITQFAVGSSPFFECVAVSKTGDPVAGGYYLYAFSTGTNFPDYPKVTVWPDAYYMSTQRGFPSSGLDVWAFERAKMLSGAPAQVVHFPVSGTSLILLPSDVDGASPPPGTPNFFVRQVDGDRFGGTDRLDLFAFHVDWTTPANSTFTQLPSLNVTAFDSVLCNAGLMGECVTQPGTTVRLETLTAWSMWRAQYRNFGTRETITFNHTVNANGVDLAGVRWYELRRPPAGNWSVFQQGTYAPDSTNRWMGSAAIDGAGNLAIGFSVSSTTVFPGLRAAVRKPNDPLGTLTHEITLVNGGGSQTFSGAPRWGNYSTMDVDPTNSCTFWFTSEYYRTTSNAGWQTSVGSFTMPNCVGPRGTFLITNLAVLNFAAWAAMPNVRRFVGDFNGDGKTDVALLGGAGWATIPIAFSNGDGSFNVTNLPINNFNAWAITPNVKLLTGDFNGDGKTDIALTGGSGWTTLPVAMSNGNGTFTVTNTPIASFGPWASASNVTPLVGDFNGDGKADIALTGNPGWASLPVAFSNGNGSFNVTNTAIASFAGWAATPNVKALVGDFNGDGKADIALTGGAGWGTIPVARSNGNGSFTVTNAPASNFAGWATASNVKVLVGDFNGDGKTDIALTGNSGWATLPVAFSNGSGTFTVTNNAIANFAGWAGTANAKALVGDFNGDGKADVALTGALGWASIPVAFSVGGGNFQVTNHAVTGFAGWAATPGASVFVGDFDGNGKKDILLTGANGWATLPVAFSISQ